jgi:protease IV
MDFVKSAWRVLVTVKDGLALLFLLLFFMLIFGALSSRGNPAKVRDGVLTFELDGVVSEQPAEIDPLSLLLSSEKPQIEYRQRDIIRALDLASKDDHVKAVALDLDRFMGGGQVSLADIGVRIDAVKKAGKPVYTYATAYSDDAYQLASHASEIWINPLGGVIFSGPGGPRAYYKDMLDKLGVKMHVYRVGTYKSAVEPYIRNDQSPEAKDAISAVYAEKWGEWKSEVQKARPQAQLAGLIDSPAATIEAAQGDLSSVALTNKLVDKSGDRIAFGKYLASKYGKDREEKTGGYASIPMQALLAANKPDRNGESIGVVTVAGTIVDGDAGDGTAAGDRIADEIYQALDEGDLKALVVRVDSPGGSVTGSERIRLAIAEAREKKLPVVISMANLAASGGYWVSTSSDMIFAEPATITGSIGIFGLIPSAEAGLAKLGMHADGVKTTPLSGEPNVMGGFSPEFDRLAQSMIENGYRDFLSRVGKARGKTPEQVDAIAQGRVWGGGTARQHGLVDRLGNLDDALAEAAKHAKLPVGGWHPVYLESHRGLAERILGNIVPRAMVSARQDAPLDAFARIAAQQDNMLQSIAADLKMMQGAQGMQARCMECAAMSGVVPRSGNQETGWLNALSRLVGS